MSSIFSRMLSGQEPARFIWRDSSVAAIVSNTPIKPGHCVVFPQQEVTNWLDLSVDLQSQLFEVCRRIGRQIQDLYQPVRVGLAIVSIAAPHVHIHLVPINTPTELDFSKQNSNASAADLDSSASQLRDRLSTP